MAVTSGARGEYIDSLNPATDEVIGSVPIHTDKQVDEAVTRAREAAEVWGQLSHDARAEQLIAWRRKLAAHADELAELMHRENGKPKTDAMSEVFMALSHLHHAAARAKKALRPRRVSTGVMANFSARVSYHPLGVVGVIGPWNYPMFTPFGSIAYALAAGNTVVFKPSEYTSLLGQRFCELAEESFTIPNVLQAVTGNGKTGAALARSGVDKLAFTGSAATGRRVMIAAAERLTPVILELGGKDPMIVTDDANVDKAAHDAVFGALTNAGQACVGIERVYVTPGAYDRFIERVLEEARKVEVGEHIGPITMPKQVDLIRSHLEDAIAKGANVLVGGPDQIRGHFVPATVLTDVTPEMKVMREETFGPVLPIAKVASVDEAIERSNETSYGLGSSVFAGSRAREIADRIRSGMTAINSVMAFSAIPTLPFGGTGESGFGRIHGDEGIREFARVKSTATERFANPMNLMSMQLPEGTYDKIAGMVKQLYGGGFVDKVTDRLRKIR
jgi:acyl-CoA reductase-like NAD-dependent aldehyde dehydrogenase